MSDTTTTTTEAAPEAVVTQTTASTPTVSTTDLSGFGAFLDADGTKFKEGWTAGLPDHLKPFEKTLSKFPSPIDLLGSYGNLEKKISAKTPTFPGAEATDEQRAEWRKLVGAPNTPEEYGLKPSEGSEGTWNADLAQTAATVAHKYGIPAEALGELVEAYNGSMKAAVESAETASAGEAERVMAELSKEWGAEASKNAARVQRGAKALGLDLDNPKYGNDPDLAKAILRFDQMTNEDGGLIGEGEKAGYHQRMEQIDTKLRSLQPGSPEAQSLVAEKRRLWEATR